CLALLTRWLTCLCQRVFFVNHPTSKLTYTLSLHDALPISAYRSRCLAGQGRLVSGASTRSPDVLAWTDGCQDMSATEPGCAGPRSEEHTSELQSREKLVCRLLLVKKKNTCTWTCLSACVPS